MKGLEVGMATFVGNAVAVQQQSTAGKRDRPRRRPKKERAQRRSAATAPAPGFDAEEVRGALEAAVRLAGQVPAVVERGGAEGKKWVKLAICVGIDLVGSGSLAVPVVGDALDLVTAPLCAVMLQALFGCTLVTVGGLAEELLPGTDGIPTATIAWVAEHYGYLDVGADGVVE